MNSPRFKEWCRPLLLTILCVAFCVGGIVSWYQITSTRVVAQATMPNGVGIMIKQSFTWSGDLFNTSFWYRPPGGKWVWRYYSHEDGYWGHGRVELDSSSRIPTVYRGGKPTIKFAWDTLVHTQFTETQRGSPRTFTPESDQ
ncbi:MAG: hypothetical protein ABIZ56_12940 [Chthoniobacteraceae bacterium]